MAKRTMDKEEADTDDNNFTNSYQSHCNGIVFVTVGTTLFNQLIRAISSENFTRNIISKSYNKIIIQYGKGNPPSKKPQENLIVTSYDYKPSLQSDMKSASLLISHAGAGSIMEGLLLQKKIIVVINNLLMNNHQYELANALHKRGYLICVHDVKKLWEEDFWNDVVDNFVPKIWKCGDDYCFSSLLDDQMSFLIDDENEKLE